MKKLASLASTLLVALSSLDCSHASTSNGELGAAATAAATANGDAVSRDLYRVPVSGLPSVGNPDALVTIVEFTDYECPFCQRAEETMARLRATYGDALRVVVAERPLPIHDRARPAALAALAADAQGRFEAMHARLFALGGSLEDEAILGAARDARLDLDRFAIDRNNAPLAPSEQLADRFDVRGTPTFFVSGRRVIGAQSYETFRDVIEERLAAARALVASGARARDVYAALTATGADHLDATKDEEDGETAGCGAGCAGGGAADVGERVEDVPTDGAPARGPAGAPITIVAFGDFECPFTARAETTTLHAVEQAHPGEVRVFFKNMPLPIHTHAALAARAALAADAQGRFWDYHDRLLARDVTLDRAGLLRLAADIDLDLPRFARDLDDPKTADRVARDGADAKTLGIEGTPTFFVNGHRIKGAQPRAVFEAAIAKAH